MRAQSALRCGVVFAVVACFGAWSAHAGSIVGPQGGPNAGIVKDNNGQQKKLARELVLQASLGAPPATQPGKLAALQGILDELKPKGPGNDDGHGFLGGLVGGKPGPIFTGSPGVNPIPESRSWVLYALGAVFGLWVVRKELRAA
jgi:hypothetical protein